MVVYIEGDGYAWRRKNRLSADPTPRNPISLKLATRDPGPHVVYLARPCQYPDEVQLNQCSSIYWSSHRYSKEVVDSINEALTKTKAQTRASTVEIIAYSGGGVIAMLVASQRDDVFRVVTLASNIDHESWSEWHGVSPLDGSLTPMNFIAQLQGINQLHLWGGKDEIVPFKSQTKFIESSEKNKRFKYKIIPGFTHDCCWVDQWQELLRP
ncbi:MAG: alpha/beta hydrolase [Proteobacteria bacterium]|nr:alpha/beta hydrolase [Pseudomonadota bacterium]